MQNQIDPAIYDQILSNGQLSADQDPQIAYQQQLAKMLRANGKAPGLIDAGRRMVAPSKLEFLGAMANNVVAGNREQQALGLQKDQNALRQQQVQMVLQALRQNNGTAKPAQYTDELNVTP